MRIILLPHAFDVFLEFFWLVHFSLPIAKWNKKRYLLYSEVVFPHKPLMTFVFGSQLLRAIELSCWSLNWCRVCLLNRIFILNIMPPSHIAIQCLRTDFFTIYEYSQCNTCPYLHNPFEMPSCWSKQTNLKIVVALQVKFTPSHHLYIDLKHKK